MFRLNLSSLAHTPSLSHISAHDTACRLIGLKMCQRLVLKIRAILRALCSVWVYFLLVLTIAYNVDALPDPAMFTRGV